MLNMGDNNNFVYTMCSHTKNAVTICRGLVSLFEVHCHRMFSPLYQPVLNVTFIRHEQSFSYDLKIHLRFSQPVSLLLLVQSHNQYMEFYLVLCLLFVGFHLNGL